MSYELRRGGQRIDRLLRLEHRERTRRRTSLGKFVACGLAIIMSILSARADNGRIPIYQPTTITASGAYVLTRDLSVTTGSAITVQGEMVTLDLGGHTITSSSASPVIWIQPTIGGGSPRASLTVKNGYISGAGSGISTSTGQRSVTELRVDGVTFRNANVWVEDGLISVVNSRFAESSLWNDGNFGAGTTRIENNNFDGGSIYVLGASSAQVRHNSIRGGSIVSGPSDGFEAASHLIEGNVVSLGEIQVAGAGAEGGLDIAIIGNVVRGAIRLTNCRGARVAENTIGGFGNSNSGIAFVYSTNGLIEGNKIRDRAIGISLDEGSSDNVFRNNVLRSNTSPVSDSGTNNTDAGGNVF